MKRSLLAVFGLGGFVAMAVSAAAGQTGQAAEGQQDQKQEADVVKREEVVVVTASKVESTLTNAPATMSVVTSESIVNSPAQNYGDLLRSVPGLNIIQTSARDINITSRQSTSTLSNSQLALLDGRSIYLDFFGLILWDFVPSSASEIKQIEVVRGPASAVWGANALTGVVNIITKSPREAAGTSLTLQSGTIDRKCDRCSQTDLGYSFGGALSHARAVNDSLAYKISAGYFNSDAYSRPTGTIPIIDDPREAGKKVGGASYPSDSTAGAFGTRFENSGTRQPKLDFRLDQEFKNGGRMTYGAGVAGTEGIVHTGIGPFDIQSGSYMYYGKLNYSQGALKVNLFANLLDVKAPNLLLPDPNTGEGVQLDFKTQTFDFEFGHSRVFAGKHVLSYGGNARRNNFDITLTPQSKDRTELGLYLQDEFFLEKFRFTVGGRVDKFGNIDDPVFSPRITAMYKPAPSQSIRVSYNKAFRSPSTVNNYLNQAIYQPVDLSLLGQLNPALKPLVAQPFPLVVYATGNEKLKEESLTAYEIGYTGTFNGKTTVGAAFYINDTDDNINFTTLPNNFDPYTPTNAPPGWNQRFGPLGPAILGLMAQRGIYLPRTAFTYKNLGPIRNKGVELSLEHSFGHEVSAFANYSYQAKPEVLVAKSDQEPYPPAELAFPPENRFNLGLSYNGKRFLGNVTLNHSDQAFWSDVLTGPYAGYTDAFNLVNATIGAKWANGKVTTSIKSTNVLNQDIQQHVFGDILKRTVVGEVRLQF